MAKRDVTPTRLFLVDVFEPSSGEEIDQLYGESMAAFPPPQPDGLVTRIDAFLIEPGGHAYPLQAVMLEDLSDLVIVPNDHTSSGRPAARSKYRSRPGR